MPKRLDDLYHCFYRQKQFNELKSSVEENHKILIEHLSKDDRKIVLRIIDALEMICNYQSKESFIQGFQLGVELTTELQHDKDRSLEKNLNDCGQFFMSKGDADDEKEN